MAEIFGHDYGQKKSENPSDQQPLDPLGCHLLKRATPPSRFCINTAITRPRRSGSIFLPVAWLHPAKACLHVKFQRTPCRKGLQESCRLDFGGGLGLKVYARIKSSAWSWEGKMVVGVGFEPTNARSGRIYSSHPLATWIPYQPKNEE